MTKKDTRSAVKIEAYYYFIVVVFFVCTVHLYNVYFNIYMQLLY